MAIIKCKMCGGDLVLSENQSVAECEYCGSKQTVPAADNEKKLTLFARAGRLRAACEFDKAAGIYEAIVADFPEEAESYWGLVLCKYGIEYVDDPATGKKIPTCHRSSFDSIMEDTDFEQALENADSVARRVYREEAKQIEEIRKGIIAVSANEQPYDIFICYKETDENGDRTLDSVLAQDLYSALTEKGYRVFFSRITLQSKLGEAYEPYIFAALNSAKVMLAIGTDPEYYSAVWVKNEWSRYLKICAGDNSKHLIPCYKDMEAYDMPREFRPLQGVDLGKMGAVQDILFNMEKYIPLKKQNTTVIQEKVVVGGTGGSNKIASLLDRGNMALEDGDWAKADSFFEDVLNNDSKNAQAYIGKTLAQEKCRTMDALVRKRRDMHQNAASEKLYIQEKTVHITEMAEKFSLLGYVKQYAIREVYSFDLSYTSQVSGWEKEYREEEKWWKNHRWLSRAEKFAVGAVAEHLQSEKKHLFAQLNDRVKKAQEADVRSVAKLEAAYGAHIAEADKQAEQLYNDGLERREKEYQNYLRIAKNEENIDQLKQAEIFFRNNRAYKDSKNLIEHCQKRIADEQAKIDAENERQRVIAEQKRKAQQKWNKMVAAFAAACVVLAVAVALVVTKVIIPGNAYQEAVALMENGQYEEAIVAFEALGDYKDAQEKADSLKELKLAAEKKVEEERIAAEKKAEEERLAAEYAAAEELEKNGKTAKAAMAFDKLKGYQNARERSLELWNQTANRETISAGGYHTVGLKSDGTVVATKYTGDERYNYGQCNVSGWSDMVAISAGSCHTVGLRADGTVAAVGDNDAGQCDVSGWTDMAAISAGGHYTVGLKTDGTVVAVGSNGAGQCNISGWTDIIAVSAGGNHTVGLKADGTVVAAGYNGAGQCNVSGWRDIIAISAGPFHTVGLKADGTVVAMGTNSDCRCDVSGWRDIIAISAGDFYTVGLKSDGTVMAVGRNDEGQCKVSHWTDIVAISAGNHYTIGLKSDGTVVAVGNNDNGKRSVSSWKDIKLPR